MAQKFIHKVSPELTDDAQYKSVSEIDSSALTQGTTILLYPGTYDAISASWNDVALIGVGDVDDVIVNGLTLSNTAVNTVTVKNLTIKGSNAAAHSLTTAIEVGSPDDASGSVTLAIRDVKLSNAEYGVIHHGSTGALSISYSDLSGVDQAVSANANTSISFSVLNTSSNAYFATGGGNTGKATVTVTAAQSGGSNTGNTVETVRALIS